MAKGVIEITLDKQVQSLLSSIDKSLRAFSKIVGGGQRGRRGGEQAIKVKVVNWNDLWTSDKGKSVVESLKKIRDNISDLSKCCDKLSKSLESFGETLRASSRSRAGSKGKRRWGRELAEEVIKDLPRGASKESLVELLFGKIGGSEWENLGEGLKKNLLEVLEGIDDEGLLAKLLGRIGGKEWKDLVKDVREELGKIFEEAGSEGLAEKLIGVIGDKSWRSLKDMEKELRDILESEEKVSLSSLIPKGSFLSPLAWSALGGLIGSVLGGLLSQMEKLRNEIGLDILAGRELAGTMELAAEMVSKTFSTASSAFQQTTYYLAQFGISVGEAIGQVQGLFAALGEGVKDFLSSGETQKMLGYFTLLGVSAETTGGLAQQFRFLRGSVKDAAKDFQSSAKMFLAAAKKMGVSVQQLVELQSRLLEGMYDIILAYRLTTQVAGVFGDQITDNAKRFSVLGAALRQQGVVGAEEVSAALMNLSTATNLSWEQIGKMGITLGVMGKEAEVSTLFISKMIGEMFGLQDIFKDAQGNISGVVKKFKEMDETSRMLAVALSPSLAPLFAVDEKVLERLDKTAREVETIQSQIKIVDSTLAAMKDKAKAILASFFAIKGVNKIISSFSKVIDQAVSRIVVFLEKHEWLAKALAILTTLSMILGTVLLQLAPALLILVPAFWGVYEVGKKVFGFLGSLISGLISMLGTLAEGLVKVFVSSFDLAVVTLKKVPKLLNELGASFKKVKDTAVKFYGFIKEKSILVDKFLFRKIGRVYEYIKLSFKEAGDVFMDFFDAVKSSVTSLGNFIVEKLGKASKFVSTVLSKSFNFIGNALLAGINLTVSLAAQFLVLGGIITWVSISLATLPVILSGFLGLITGVSAVVVYLVKNFTQLKDLFAGLIASSDVFYKNLKNAWEVFMGVLEGEKGLSDLVKAFDQLFSAESKKSFKALIDNLLNKGVLQQLVTTLLNIFVGGFINGFKMAWEFLYKFITGGGLYGIYEAIKSTILSALGAGGENFLKNFLNQFGQVVATIADLLVNIIIDIASVLPSLIGTLGEVIVNNILPTALKVAIKLLETLPSILTKIVMSIVSLLPNLLKSLVANIPSLIKAAASALANILISLINEVIPALLSTLVEALPDLVSALGDVIGHVIDSLFEVLANIDWLKLLGGIIEAVFKIIFKVLPALFGSFIKILGKVLWGIVKTLLSWVLKPLWSVLKFLGKLVGIGVDEVKAAELDKAFQGYEVLGESIESLSESFSVFGDAIKENTNETKFNTDAIRKQTEKIGKPGSGELQKPLTPEEAERRILEILGKYFIPVNPPVGGASDANGKQNEKTSKPDSSGLQRMLTPEAQEAEKRILNILGKHFVPVNPPVGGTSDANGVVKPKSAGKNNIVGSGTSGMLLGAWGMFWAMGKILNVVGERLYNHFTKIRGKVEEKINAVTVDASNLIINLINETTATVKTGVSSLVSNTASILKNLWESLTTAFQGLPSLDINVSGVFDKIVSIFNEIIDFLTKPFSGLIKKIEGINLGNVGDILNKVSGALKKLLDIIGESKLWLNIIGIRLSSSRNLGFGGGNILTSVGLKLGEDEGWQGSGVVRDGLAGKTVLIGQSESGLSAHLVDIGSKQIDTLTLIAFHLAEIKDLLKRNAGQGQDIVINISSFDTNGYNTRA